MVNNNPIGLFDSGVGGTSIWREINKLIPNESCIYLSDSKNAPYGQKNKQEIIDLSIKNTNFLLKEKCKLIVVACNTATTNAIKELRSKFDIPFIGIEPAIKPAATNSKTNTIGILATQGTLNSDLFHETVSNFENVTIIEQIGHGLVQLIENGEINSTRMQELLQEYLNPMIAANIDYLVLGCSHYPYLLPEIKKILPKSIHIIDSGEAVAKQTLAILKTTVGIRVSNAKSTQTFYTNGKPEIVNAILNNEFTVTFKDF